MLTADRILFIDVFGQITHLRADLVLCISDYECLNEYFQLFPLHKVTGGAF